MCRRIAVFPSCGAILCLALACVLLQLRQNGIPIFSIWHDKKAIAFAKFFPFVANHFLFFGVFIAPKVSAFVFDNKMFSIGEFTNEVGIKLVCCCLKPERKFWVSFQISNPAFDFGMCVQKSGALEFFAFGFQIANDLIVVVFEII